MNFIEFENQLTNGKATHSVYRASNGSLYFTAGFWGELTGKTERETETLKRLASFVAQWGSLIDNYINQQFNTLLCDEVIYVNLNTDNDLLSLILANEDTEREGACSSEPAAALTPPINSDQRRFDEYIKALLPQDSTVLGAELQENFGSVFVNIVHQLSPASHLKDESIFQKRILSIRLIQSPQDRGTAATSYAAPKEYADLSEPGKPLVLWSEANMRQIVKFDNDSCSIMVMERVNKSESFLAVSTITLGLDDIERIRRQLLYKRTPLVV